MTTVEISVLCFASIATTGCVCFFWAWRRSDALSFARLNQLGELTLILSEKEYTGTKLVEDNKSLREENKNLKTALANSQQQLARSRAFADDLESLCVRFGGDAGAGEAEAQFWKEKAMEFLAELKVLDAEKRFEALMEFLSRMTHHPSPGVR